MAKMLNSFKADKIFEVGQSYLAKCGWACDTDVVITVTKRTKRTVYFLLTSQRHGCDGVIRKATIKRMRDANGSGECVEVGGEKNSLMSGLYFCAWYDLIGRMAEEEAFLCEACHMYDKNLTYEDLLSRAAHSWAWCFAE